MASHSHVIMILNVVPQLWRCHFIFLWALPYSNRLQSADVIRQDVRSRPVHPRRSAVTKWSHGKTARLWKLDLRSKVTQLTFFQMRRAGGVEAKQTPFQPFRQMLRTRCHHRIDTLLAYSSIKSLMKYRPKLLYQMTRLTKSSLHTRPQQVGSTNNALKLLNKPIILRIGCIVSFALTYLILLPHQDTKRHDSYYAKASNLSLFCP